MNQHNPLSLALAGCISLSLLASACQRRGDNEELRDAEPIEAAPQVSQPLYALGQALFFDKILSGNQDVSCASCHHPSVGTDDDMVLPLGVGAEGIGQARSGGVRIARNAPALFNLHLYPAMFWDSRIRLDGDGDIESPAGAQLTQDMQNTLRQSVVGAQAMFPVTSAAEMRGAAGSNELANLADDDFTGIWRGLMQRLGGIDTYVAMFEAAYPGQAFSQMTFAHAAGAIAAFEVRAFERRDSPFQRFLQGDDNALSMRERNGLRDFREAGCDNCHSGPLLSDFEHHNTALAQLGPSAGHGADGMDDFGREGVSGRSQDRYQFRTTPLINVELSAPYGHAGQFADLRSFVDHYRRPEESLEDYDASRHIPDAELAGSVISNTGALLASIDRDMDLRRFNTDDVVEFLRATTAVDEPDLRDTIPDSVPSGLPLD